MSTAGDIPMWVIYRGASDRNGAPFTVRRHVVGHTGVRVAMNAYDFDTIERAREHVVWSAWRNYGLHPARLDRHAEDDPVIAELWL